MARRLEEATEDALLTGGRAGRRAVEDAGFSDELKNRLLEKIADVKFREEHSSAFSQAGITSKLPASAGEGTRIMATGEAWTGEELQADAVLRMLDDAHKPLKPGLRGKPNIPSPIPMDMRLKKEPRVSPGLKYANARDKASVYSGMGMKEMDMNSLSHEEREARRKELRERFTPAARALPNTLSGLAALANERIEDAIARGQFKNIPRGRGVDRDARADNPFIDTTEYIMNKMIKRQNIVPPWIEKQQDLVKAANVFRSRLRNDWKRHAARTIASQGGSLQYQMDMAREYAHAEEVHNPRRRNVDTIAVPTNSTDDVVMVKIREQATTADSPLEVLIEEAAEPRAEQPGPSNAEAQSTLMQPFRDDAWEATERSYMELAVSNLNALTRSYNLMAPDLAKKPYFSLERELKACFADVAPQLADAIKDRATRPSKSLVNTVGHRPGSVLDRFGREGKTTKIYDSKTPHYGFKQMWRDLWSQTGRSE